MKFTVFDTFNNRAISHHRTLANAVRARLKHSRMIREVCGQNSYIPKTILCNGEPMSVELLDEANDIQHAIECGNL